ncbi:MAG: hypothetical protein JF888_07860 [Candidatus Dormibacteraeota bacterium]|uniref:Uncharacterized protein n=1 Tax=Candidatus Dormiibacter inghamiae TaxID=3127013 RepID=A0A934K7D6_9BACT|nr:hypothetical protein [Candidatus Dormibacteraeota bacterium]MBJ7606934.1 hypothetical protein [Candidatus Dormibacteraeota bacterium]
MGEVKRRTKVISRFPGETSCLSLGWAVMDLVIATGRGLALTDFEVDKWIFQGSDSRLSLSRVIALGELSRPLKSAGTPHAGHACQDAWCCMQRRRSLLPLSGKLANG